jgi:hypothetical protein
MAMATWSGAVIGAVWAATHERRKMALRLPVGTMRFPMISGVFT